MTVPRIKKRYIRFAGSITVYTILLFGMVSSMYLMGHQSPLMAMMEGQFSVQGDDPDQSEWINGSTGGNINWTEGNENISTNSSKPFVQNFLNALISVMSTPAALSAILVIGLSSMIIGGGGIGNIVSFLVPALFILVIINTVVLPIDFIYHNSMPFVIQIIIIGFMNLLLMLTIIEFIAGRD